MKSTAGSLCVSSSFLFADDACVVRQGPAGLVYTGKKCNCPQMPAKSLDRGVVCLGALVVRPLVGRAQRFGGWVRIWNVGLRNGRLFRMVRWAKPVTVPLRRFWPQEVVNVGLLKKCSRITQWSPKTALARLKPHCFAGTLASCRLLQQPRCPC